MQLFTGFSKDFGYRLQVRLISSEVWFLSSHFPRCLDLALVFARRVNSTHGPFVYRVVPCVPY